MSSDLVNSAWVLYGCAAIFTIMYLDKRAYTADLNLPARFTVQLGIVLASLLFWITWPLIWLRRLKQVLHR